MKKYLPLISAMSIGLLLTACAGGGTSVVLERDGANYPPATNTVLLTQAPDRPYKQIAILESRGKLGTHISALFEDMRKQGQLLGADAVLPVQDLSEDQYLGVVYDSWVGGYRPAHGRIPIFRGVAIKYETNDSPAAGQTPVSR